MVIICCKCSVLLFSGVFNMVLINCCNTGSYLFLICLFFISLRMILVLGLLCVDCWKFIFLNSECKNVLGCVLCGKLKIECLIDFSVVLLCFCVLLRLKLFILSKGNFCKGLW